MFTLVLALWLLRWRHLLLAQWGSGLALGTALALLHGNTLLQEQLPQACVKLPLTITGTVTSLPATALIHSGQMRQRFNFHVTSLTPLRCRGPSAVLLSYYGPQQMIPGDDWQFKVKLQRPWGLANPGGFNMQAWFAQSAINAVGSVSKGSAQRLPATTSLRTVHHRLRLAIRDHIAGLALEGDVKAVLRALTVADKSAIDARLWSVLQQFGINHLLVISGLHIGLVAGAAYLLGGLVARLYLLATGATALWLPAVLALVVASCYAALAGFSLATQRALCMLVCFIVAGLARRSSSSGNNLLLAAVLVLVLNPLAALGSGFWLSFGAVAALLWLGCWQRGARWYIRMPGTHLFMAGVMIPMGAWWFGGSSVVAAAANLMLIPLVGLIVVPLALLATVSFLCGLTLEPLLWRLAAWPLQQLLPAARQIVAAGQPWLYQSISGELLAVLLALLAIAVFIVPAGIVLRLLSLVLMLPLLLPSESPSAIATESTRVTVLDVGQGTAIVISSGDRTLLYDTGGGDPAGVNVASSAVLPYLRHHAINTLDTFVISHTDNDHSAGTVGVLRAMPVARLRYGGPPANVTSGKLCMAGEAWRWPGGQRFQFLSPGTETALSSNNTSCVLQIEIGPYTLLLTGDIESARERELVRYWGQGLHSDWLLAAHHGSLTSSSQALLKTVRPGTVIVSAGYANRFGHPHPEVVTRIHRSGASILSTAEGGALEFEFAPGLPPVVHAYRKRVRRYWM
ncbi:MAG: DNA internalization-related competence protein ComEC/Rec2 [Halioglobus sp.]